MEESFNMVFIGPKAEAPKPWEVVSLILLLITSWKTTKTEAPSKQDAKTLSCCRSAFREPTKVLPGYPGTGIVANQTFGTKVRTCQSSLRLVLSVGFKGKPKGSQPFWGPIPKRQT